MSKGLMIWLTVATILILIGVVIFVIVMSVNGWDFSKISTVKSEENKHEISETFENITIITDTADITFLVSSDGLCRVECVDQPRIKHSVFVSDGTLNIKIEDERRWYEYIGIGFRSKKINVYLPQNEYASLLINNNTGDINIPEGFMFGGVDIKASTGDIMFGASAFENIKMRTTTGKITVEKISAQALDLSVSSGNITVDSAKCTGDVSIKVSTGKTTLENINCKNLTSSGSTGDILLRNVIASEKFDIKRTTGDITFDCADASEIKVSASTGDVTGTLLSEKIFLASTSTGRAEYPHSTVGGVCEINLTTGDIIIEIK